MRATRVVAMGAAAAALVGLGAAGALLGRGGAPAGAAVEAPDGRASGSAEAHAGHETPAPNPVRAAAPEGEVRVTPEMVARAGIRTATVSSRAVDEALEVPGVVEANAYRQVRVTPLVGGIVTRVHAELGMTVRKGDPLVTIYSPELHEMQSRYQSMLAMAETERRKAERARALAEMGVVSRQAVEEADTVAASRATELDAARHQLEILGIRRGEIDRLTGRGHGLSEVLVRAPRRGAVTARAANQGAVVERGADLVTVTDLAEVWVVANIYERDFARVQVGSGAVVRTSAYPDLALRGRASYIDPHVDAATRTARVRVAVPNEDGRLRLGMYATVAFAGEATRSEVVVPRSAVQSLADRHVVYVPAGEHGEHEGRFAERAVRIGRRVGDLVEVLDGLSAGETVVVEGSFYLRAEGGRASPLGAPLHEGH